MSSKSGGAKRKKDGIKVVADNRKASYNYTLGPFYEAGIVLEGNEVKALRTSKASINEAYVQIKDNIAFLINAHVSDYQKAAALTSHEPRRPRKLLLHRREINKLNQAIKKKGMTLIPTKLFFNTRGLAKLDIALAVGKKTYDKRDTEKKRDWQRQKARIMRHASS